MNATPPALNADERDALLGIAVDTIGYALATGVAHVPEDVGVEHRALRVPGAPFVTLERNQRLLGCVGTLEARQPLAAAVAHHALAAAFADPRVPPITIDDFVAMTVKVSVLSRTEPLAAASVADVVAGVRPGIDGLVLDARGRGATLLPSVWAQLGEPDEFLDALWCKAGLSPGAWPQGTRVLRYTTTEFSSAGPRSLPTGAPSVAGLATH
jgi:hypothetical protein